MRAAVLPSGALFLDTASAPDAADGLTPTARTRLSRAEARRAPEPVVAPRGRRFAVTFWGQAWADNLERYSDLANRLPCGPRLPAQRLRAGPGHPPRAGRGLRGRQREPYRVTIGLAPLAKARWRRVVTRCTGRIGSLVGLLRGKLSDDVLAVLTDARDGLFPEPRELALDCSRTAPASASTWRRSSTACRSDWTPGRNCSSTCARWTRRS